MRYPNATFLPVPLPFPSFPFAAVKQWGLGFLAGMAELQQNPFSTRPIAQSCQC